MISGSIVALVTPMDAAGAVDYAALRGLVDWHIQEGTDAIVAVGTTGESSTLGVHEHVEVVRKVLEYAAGRVPVLAGTGANSTTEAIELTREGKKAGAQACLMVTPYYNKPPQEGLYQHYKKVAETVDIPIILYNVPGRTGCDMAPATVKRLAQVPGIAGLKEAHGTLDRIRELLALRLPPTFTLLSGDDATACESILLGCHGDISVTANVAPKLMHEMCAAARKGDRARATALDAKLQPLHKHLFVEPNPIPVKWALQQMKKIGPGIRLPLVPLDSAHYETVRGALRAAGAM
jgi:4-hydroxy-tetrahydrodipicolinate synthase